MSKVIPILPCVNINEQCAFYESLGFTTTAKYTAPNAYTVVEFDDITLHFWGSRKHDPSGNACMIFVEVDDADAWNAKFCGGIKKAWGKIPRAGIPRISKVRELKDDKRFTICDPAGNTLYFGTPTDGKEVSSRTLENEKHAKAFAVVYNLLHSHEEPEKAAKALSKFMGCRDELNNSDKEKLDALVLEIEEAKNHREEHD